MQAYCYPKEVGPELKAIYRGMSSKVILDKRIESLPNQEGLRLAEINNLRCIVDGILVDPVTPQERKYKAQDLREVRKRIRIMKLNPNYAGKHEQFK